MTHTVFIKNMNIFSWTQFTVAFYSFSTFFTVFGFTTTTKRRKIRSWKSDPINQKSCHRHHNAINDENVGYCECPFTVRPHLYADWCKCGNTGRWLAVTVNRYPITDEAKWRIHLTRGMTWRNSQRQDTKNTTSFWPNLRDTILSQILQKLHSILFSRINVTCSQCVKLRIQDDVNWINTSFYVIGGVSGSEGVSM